MFKNLFSTVLVVLLTFTAIAQPGSNDNNFNTIDQGFGFGDGVDLGYVNSSNILPDGSIFIGGSFTTYNGTSANRVALLDTNGRIIPTFNSGSGANSSVYCSAVQNDGKIIIAGSFSSYNGTNITRIARLNIDGSLDTSFDPGQGPNSSVYTIEIQSNGKILIGGEFTSFNAISSNHLARLNTDGSADLSFNIGTGADSWVRSINQLSNGSIIIAGWFSSFNGTNRNYIARIDSTGAIDTSFDSGVGADNEIGLSLIQSDGKIIVIGDFSTFNGISRNRIARLNANGTLDMTFNPGTGAFGGIASAIIQPNGRILIGGGFSSFDGSNFKGMARLLTGGTIDSSFHPGEGLNEPIRTMSLNTDGKIIIGGNFTSYNQIGRNKVARILYNGTFDNTFNTGTGADNWLRSINILDNGEIIIAGDMTNFNGTSRNHLAGLYSNGAINTLFNPVYGANASILTTAVQNDNKVIIGGNFTEYSGTSVNRVARLNADGFIDPTYNIGTGANQSVNDIAIQSDGKVIIVGNFSSFNSTASKRIARLNTDGTLDATFNIGTGANYPITTVEIQNDGKILIGGNFTNYNGIARNRIARINADGSLDTTFDPGTGANSNLYDICVQSDGKILIAGMFTSFNTVTSNYITRLNADGSLDTSFNPGSGANDDVRTMELQTDGRILIGGDFTNFNGVSCSHLARLNIDGSCDIYFDTSIGASDIVSDIAISNNGRIHIVGKFTSYDGIGRNRLARINVNFMDTASICQGETYSWHGGSYGSQNFYYDSLTTAAGHDSIFVLVLKVNPLYEIAESATICNDAMYNWHGVDYSTSGIYYDSLLSVNGCDSIYQLSLEVAPNYLMETDHSMCNGSVYNWRGNDYSASGIYFDSLSTSSGCDSIYQLTLEVEMYTFTNEASICSGESFNWHGNTYSSPGIYYDSLTTLNGCDSIYELIINSGSYFILEEAMICEGDTYLWHGNNFAVSGTYSDSLLSVSGCDSIHELSLIVNPNYSFDEVHSICNGETYNWHGQYLSTDGVYQDILSTATGCDSIYQLTLSVHPNYNFIDEINICDGEAYLWRGTEYTSSGTFTDSLSSINGCDSIYLLDLNVTIIDTSTTLAGSTVTVNTAADTYQWINCDENNTLIIGATDQSYTATNTGSYAAIITMGLCSDTSTCIIISNIGIEQTDLINTLKVYPVPFSNELIISSESATGKINYEILNTLGQLAKKGQFSSNTKINTSEFASGIYILSLKQNDKIQYRKLVKE